MSETKQVVKERYASAAREKEGDLCCPTGYSGDETRHIPKEVLDVSYGCGNPTAFSSLKGGETVLDLGSGAGIDCFIAAKKVGKQGKVIGLDMTDEMLEKAKKNKPKVVEALGYDNIEFRKGVLETMPVTDCSVDLVISNCVINLSTLKQEVFNEIYRVLKDGGEFVISDIVSDKEFPTHLKQDKDLWSGCISGAVTRKKYLSFMENASFYGIRVLKQSVWKEVEGVKAISAIFTGHKLEKSDSAYADEIAMYLGPLKVVKDDEGHSFERGIPRKVCIDTARRLRLPPYGGMFSVSENGEQRNEKKCC